MDASSIVLLTREGCPNTPQMYQRLVEALRALNIELAPEVLDLGSLPPTDPRTGYGTPSILVRGEDLFGAPKPRPAPPT